MKKLLTLLTTGVAIVALSACGKKGNDLLPEGKYEEFDFRGTGYMDRDYIALKQLLVNLKVGESKALNIESFPNKYALESLEFASSNTDIATVDSSGNVTGVALGHCDIEVKAKDGSFSNNIRVVVSKKSTSSGSASVIQSIKDKYNDASYKSPTKVIRYEYSVEEYACEGVRDHATESYEVMGYDMETGYFFVDGPSVYFKTPGGAPEVKDGKWIFYPINQGIKTRLIHETPTSKNFYDINTASYDSYDKIIRDIMNFFFVSGEKILTNLMDDFDGKENFNDFSGESSTSFYAVDEDSLVLEYTESNDNQVVDAEDEIDYYDIPADTVYSYDYHQTFLNSNNRTRGVDIGITFYYELDGKNWTRVFNRSQLLDEDFEYEKISKPSENGYTEVYSIYDL
jgi:hypothetical protein